MRANTSAKPHPFSFRFGLGLALGLGLGACDKKSEASPSADDANAVADGAKPRTAAGQQVEVGKQRVKEAEAKLQKRDDAILDAAGQDGSVQKRGM